MTAGDDPVCPECGEPVGTTATYCMHCYADLPWTEEGETATDEMPTADPAADDDGGVVDRIIGDAASTDTTTADATPEATDMPGADAPNATDAATADQAAAATTAADAGDDHLLDPDGMADDFLTVVVAVVGSVAIGLLGTIALLVMTESIWAFPVGVVAWLGGLAYLARQYSVQATIGKTFYGGAAVLLLLPFIAVSPAVEGGLGARLAFFVTTLLVVVIPAGVLGALGWGVLRFAPDPD